MQSDTNRSTIIVCGGRAFDNVAHANAVLNRLHFAVPIGAVHVGSQRGADGYAIDWAHLEGACESPGERTITYEIHEAAWHEFGRSAGPRRNSAMLAKAQPDFVVAFPGGRGTDDMVRKALDAGLSVLTSDWILAATHDEIRLAVAARDAARAATDASGALARHTKGGAA
jgi:YspA, cpYpsA-related SLOG family